MRFRRSAWALLVTGVWIGIGAQVFGQDNDAPPREAPALLENPFPMSEASARAGKQVYDRLCVTCHAMDGKGVADMAQHLGAPPSDLTDGHWSCCETDEDIFNLIRRGTQTGMEGYADRINETRTWHVINYLRSLSGNTEISIEADEVPENPIPYGTESIRRGRILYENYCALCHAIDGTGYTDYLDFLSTPPADFTTGEFRYGDRDGDIFEIIRDGTSRDMESFKDRLKDDDMWHMVNYIRRFSR